MGCNKVYLGTELKMNINIKPVENLTMDDYDFVCTAFCSNSKKVEATKQECNRIDADNYIFRVDTEKTGPGVLKIKVVAYIPDTDFPDSLRTEVSLVNTGIIVERIQ